MLSARASIRFGGEREALFVLSSRSGRSSSSSSTTSSSSFCFSARGKESDWIKRRRRRRRSVDGGKGKGKKGATVASGALTSMVSSMDPTTQSFMMTHAVVRDVVATVLTISGSLLWVKLFDELARREILEAKLSRKLVHVTSGTFFAMTWCLFGDQWYSKAFATLVPSLQAFRLFAIGSGLIENKNAVRAVSRGGGKEELLYGPFYYTIVLMVTTLLFWRESPVGFLVVSLMCGGDGVADIVGRRLGKTGKKWPKPFDERKSFAGSAAMVIAGFLFTVSLTHLFGVMGFFPNNRVFGGPDDIGYYAVILLACLSCAVVEALPASKVDDNISVAAVAALLGSLAFL